MVTMVSCIEVCVKSLCFSSLVLSELCLPSSRWHTGGHPPLLSIPPLFSFSGVFNSLWNNWFKQESSMNATTLSKMLWGDRLLGHYESVTHRLFAHVNGRICFYKSPGGQQSNRGSRPRSPNNGTPWDGPPSVLPQDAFSIIGSAVSW